MKFLTYDEVDPDAVYRLMSTSFGWGGVTASAVQRERREDPRCFEGFAFYAVENGKPVAQVIPFRMRVRLATGIETIGAIAGVCSHPAKWGQGYARRTMERAHEWFREEGLRIAALTTSRNIRGFGLYRKMGYTELGPFFRAYRTLPRKRLRPKGIRLRKARRGDLPLIVRLFGASTRGLLGWTVRSVEEFRASLTWNSRSIHRYRIVLRGGMPVAYFRTLASNDVLFDELVAPRGEDFRATLELLEAESRSR
ncbi:MAG: GNAT family N-acetyltransferase, partial [Thermoplasmata archaeon]